MDLEAPELAASFYQACDLAFWHFSDLEFAPTEGRSPQQIGRGQLVGWLERGETIRFIWQR
jgi:hypothetical protein